MDEKERGLGVFGDPDAPIEEPVSDRWMLVLVVVLLVLAFFACGLMAYSTGVFS